jgi:hypothetical protein
MEHMYHDKVHNEVVCFSTERRTFFVPSTYGTAPRSCLSAESIVYRDEMYTVGGWLPRFPHLQPDFYVLRLGLDEQEAEDLLPTDLSM